MGTAGKAEIKSSLPYCHVSVLSHIISFTDKQLILICRCLNPNDFFMPRNNQGSRKEERPMTAYLWLWNVPEGKALAGNDQPKPSFPTPQGMLNQENSSWGSQGWEVSISGVSPLCALGSREGSCSAPMADLCSLTATENMQKHLSSFRKVGVFTGKWKLSLKE